MYLVPADCLHEDKSSPLKNRKRHPKIKKHKHHPYQQQVKIHKHHPYEEWVKMCKTIDEADIRKKTDTNAFVDF